MDNVIGNLVTDLMCSDVCPCPNDQNAKKWTEIEEAVLNTYGRTKNAKSTDELRALRFIDNELQAYTNFEECF